jgi:hypothetical protein
MEKANPWIAGLTLISTNLDGHSDDFSDSRCVRGVVGSWVGGLPCTRAYGARPSFI